MTNILAAITVSIVTNTAEAFPTEQVLVPCPGAQQGNTMLAVACFETRNIPNPTNKTITTTCKAVTNATVRGVTFPIGECVLWSTSRVEVLKQEWVPKQ